MSSTATVLNVKIDADLKRQAQHVAKKMGLPLSTVVAVSLKDIVRRGYLTVSVDSQPLKPEIEAELLKIAADAKRGVNVSPAFNVKDKAAMRAWLEAPQNDD